MPVGYRLPAGGLPSAAKALLTPENIRAGVHIKGGGVDVTGSYKGAIFVYLGIAGGTNGEYEICTVSSPITTLITPSITHDRNEFWATLTVKESFKGRLQIVDRSGFERMSMTYGSVSITSGTSNVLDFVTGDKISANGKMYGMTAGRVGAIGIVLAE